MPGPGPGLLAPTTSALLPAAQGLEATQSRLCEILALTCRSLPPSQVESHLSSLVQLLPSPTHPCGGLSEQREAVGAMLSIGLIGSYQLEATGAAASPLHPLLSRAARAIASLLAHEQSGVAAAAAAAIGSLGSLAPLPLPEEQSDELVAPLSGEQGEAGGKLRQEKEVPRSKLAVVHRLTAMLSGLKTKEKAREYQYERVSVSYSTSKAGCP